MPSDRHWERAEVLSLSAKLLNDYDLTQHAVEAWFRAIEIAKSGQQAPPDDADCSAVLANITKMLVDSGHLELAKRAANSITNASKEALAKQFIQEAEGHPG